MELEDEMPRTLLSPAKDTNLVAANDRHHLGNARVFTADDVVQLLEERDRLDREKVPTAKTCNETPTAMVVSSG
jgi:hypothetical protein